MSAPPRPSVAAHGDQTACLEELAAELNRRKWIAYLAATLPQQAPRLFVAHPGNHAVGEHIVAAPEATTGSWWYWRGSAEPVAAADAPGAAADAIIDALSRSDALGGDGRQGRPHAGPGSPSPLPAAGGGRSRAAAAATAAPGETSRRAR
jgi:hypothetical protein